jgi:hypothetical protein
MRKEHRYIIYFAVFIVVMMLPQLFEITIYFYKKFEVVVVKEYFWTSVSLAFLALLIEFFYLHRHEYEVTLHEKDNTQVSPLYFDGPTSNDLFNRRYYAKLLLEKIYSSFCKNKVSVKHSFVIHIGEHYGQGKTSFLIMFDEEVSKSDHKMIIINFEPWLCDTETGIVNEFFDTFRIEVGEYLPKLNGSIKRYVELLLSAIKYERKGFSFNLNSFMRNDSTLKSTHDLIKKELMNIDRPVIITIDDVDRLQSKELMVVLKIIRDTADFPNVFYIVAADNLHLRRMLNNMNIDDAETYLKKFFNLEFQLPANENVAFKKLLELLNGKFEELRIDSFTRDNYISQIENVLYIKEAFPNLRDVYRFVNSYFLAIDAMEDACELNLFDLFLLTMIQTLNLEYYMQLRDNSLNILNVVHSDNDLLLEWKGDLNIILRKQEKEALEHIERTKEKDFNTPRKEKLSSDIVIPSFEETVKKAQITQSDIIPVLMNLLFGTGMRNVAANRACRHNMFFKYFSNTNATYMVSRMELVDMLNSDEKTYRRELNHLFERNKDSHFLSEIIYAAPYMDKYDEVKVLKRFFTFIELSYHYKRDLTNIDFIKSLAGYENWVSSKQKLCNLLFFLYGKNRQKNNLEDKQKAFVNLCKDYDNINILLVCLNIMSNQIEHFIFGRKMIDDASKSLIDRFFNEKVSQSNGELDIQAIDTIASIKDEFDLRDVWMAIFEKYLKENKIACLNLLSKLVVFYDNGKIGWNYPYRKALLGEYQLPKENILTHLAETHTDEKEIYDSLLGLFNHFRDLYDVSDLMNVPFIKMAKAKQTGK